MLTIPSQVGAGMDKAAPNRAKQAARAAAPPAKAEPYGGLAGQTRREMIHVPIPGGYVRSVEVFRGVNVATHPDLRAPALAGALHRFDSGEALAVSFVFHDPTAEKFALVVPEPLRHRALYEFAALFERIAEDAEFPVPAYVRRARVVIGAAELESYLEETPAGDDGATRAAAHAASELTAERAAIDAEARAQQLRRGELETREGSLTAREGDIETRERRLHVRAEDVTRREDEVRSLAEELEVGQREIALREQELERRVTILQRREAAYKDRIASNGLDEGGTAEVDMAELEELGALRGRISSLEPPSGASLLESVELVDDEVTTISTDSVEVIADDELEVLGEDEVEDLPDSPEPVHTAFQEARTVVADAASVTIALDLSDLPVPPPERFATDEQMQMAATLADDVWLFARLGEGHEQAFRGEGVELLAQLSVIDDYPVVLLALVERGDGRPYVRRAALDPREPGERAILDALASEFAAELACFEARGEHACTLSIGADRAANLRKILDNVDSRRERPVIDRATALERALAAPPPIRAKDHPFHDEQPSARSLEDAAAALERLSDWSTTDRLQHIEQVVSVPVSVVERASRRIFEDAFSHGLVPSREMLDRALDLELVADVRAFVAQQLETFVATAGKSADQLGDKPLAQNWQRLLDLAAAHEVAVANETADAAWAAIRAAGGGEHMPVLETDPEALKKLSQGDLEALLEHPRSLLPAALELCRREDAAGLRAVAKAMRKTTPDGVIAIVVALSAIGEVAADVLIDGLTAKAGHVRHASALGLGRMQLRRAVVPLMHLLLEERTPLWRDVARILAGFGAGALRSVGRFLKDPKGAEERLAWMLAHFANHGCEEQVERLRGDRDRSQAAVAERAMELCEPARIYAAGVEADAAEVEVGAVGSAEGAAAGAATAAGPGGEDAGLGDDVDYGALARHFASAVAET